MKKCLKFVFSGYFLSLVMILLEVAVLFLLIVRLSAYSIYFLLFTLAVNFLSLLAVINSDTNPEYKVTWIAVILLMPILGSLLYILLRSRGMSKAEQKRAAQITEAISKWTGDNPSIDLLRGENLEAYCRAGAILNASRTSRLYIKTDSRYFPCGEDMYTEMLKDIENAKHFIFLEYFIIEDGVMWQGILTVLERKIKEGVEVRLLIDDIGCIGKVERGFDIQMHKKGIKLLRFGKFTPRFSQRHNNRDHRKLLIIDGIVGYTGGINIADEYINVKDRFGHWKDGGIRLSGPAVSGMSAMFLFMWDMTAKEMSDYGLYLKEKSEMPIPVSNNTGFVLPFASGPKPLYSVGIGKRAFLDMIERSQRYVYITTPYLIIDYDLSEALSGAALRGVDVRIITPSKADKRFVKIMTKGSYMTLIKSGVRIFEYTPGFIHEKTIVSDDMYAIVGTINFDFRSLAHHYEDAVWLYDSGTVLDIKRGLEDTLSRSEEIDETKARMNFLSRIFRSLLRLFSPLL